MNTNPTDATMIHALRILGQFWLEEVQADDFKTIMALPPLGETVLDDQTTLTDLAVEHQRLFGFNLPPHESIFLDPSVMLMAPATERVQRLYHEAGWAMPTDVRAGAPDHIGVEMLALADWLEAGQDALARRLLTEHLAVWMPPLGLTLARLKPMPFYARLAALTQDLLLSLLPESSAEASEYQFPDLPPPPVYRGTDGSVRGDHRFDDGAQPQEKTSLRQLLTRLLTPCRTGLYLMRQDIARISRRLDLSPSMGERYRLLDTLFRQAGQYDLVPDLFEQLADQLRQAETAYQQLATETPVWTPYATAWTRRLTDTQTLLTELRATVAQEMSHE